MFRLLLLTLSGVWFAISSAAQEPPPAATTFETLSASADKARDSERLDEAIPLYEKALALRPDWAAGWWSLGTIQYDRSDYASAARAFEKVVALDPKAGTALAMLGLCEFELGREDSALMHLQESRNVGVAKDPQMRQVMFFHEGVLLQRKGRFEAAHEALASLCLSGVQSPDVMQALGLAALRLRDKNPPPEGTTKAKIIERIGRAECLAGQKKVDEARAEYEAVVSTNPTFPNIHYAYGKFLLDSSDIKKGVEQLEQEIRNDPGHVIARLQIAAAWYKVNSAAGLPYAEAAVKLDPKYPFGHYLLGLLLLDTDNFQQAIPELETAARDYPAEAQVFFALGSAYSRAGRTEDAARARATFLKLKQENVSKEATDEFERPGTLQKKTGGAEAGIPPQ